MKNKIFEILFGTWNLCGIILCIELFLFPAVMNYNLDINKIPLTKMETIQTRFSYIHDLIEPMGIATAMVILSPISATLVGDIEYDLIINKLKAN